MVALSVNSQTLCDKCDHSEALDQLREIVQESSGTGSFANRFLGKLSAVGKIGDVLRNLTDKKIHDLGGVDVVKQLAGELYDKYVAPIDIPWVPNLIEVTMVDPWLRSMLLRMVDEAHDAVHGGS